MKKLQIKHKIGIVKTLGTGRQWAIDGVTGKQMEVKALSYVGKVNGHTYYMDRRHSILECGRDKFKCSCHKTSYGQNQKETQKK